MTTAETKLTASDVLTTNNPGFNELLRGGFRVPQGPPGDNRGLVLLIRGKAGTGKSTLALQIASSVVANRCRDLEKAKKKKKKKTAEATPGTMRRGTYYSIEQSAHDLEKKLADMYASAFLQGFRKLKRKAPVFQEYVGHPVKSTVWQALCTIDRMGAEPKLSPAQIVFKNALILGEFDGLVADSVDNPFDLSHLADVFDPDTKIEKETNEERRARVNGNLATLSEFAKANLPLEFYTNSDEDNRDEPMRVHLSRKASKLQQLDT